MVVIPQGAMSKPVRSCRAFEKRPPQAVLHNGGEALHLSAAALPHCRATVKSMFFDQRTTACAGAGGYEREEFAGDSA